MRPYHRVTHCVFLASLLSVTALLAACSGAAAPLPAEKSPGVGQPIGRLVPNANKKIKHIVVIIQENQSFDHFFNGYPGADTVQSGPTHTGQIVQLVKQHLGVATGTSHFSPDFLVNYDGGKMDGFDLNTNWTKPRLNAYTYTDPADIQPYWTMAQQYVLDDEFFTSNIDASMIAHQYVIAAQGNHAVNLPTLSWGCADNPNYIPTLNQDRSVGPQESPCFDYQTLGDELDAAGLTWHYYATYITCPPSQPSCDTSGGGFSAYQAINHIYNGPDWSKDVISPETQILQDIPNGILSNVTWVTPNYCNSDHPGSLSGSCPDGVHGPSWVASIVNAIGESKFWNSTEILIFWDEWGGEYDHVKPPYKDYDGDGFRVPLLCISPYAYQGKVNHKVLEVAGIPKFIEKTFGLATLADADARALSADTQCTNPNQTTPRPFSPIPSQLGPQYFLHHHRHATWPKDVE